VPLGAIHSGAVPSFHSIEAPPMNTPLKCGSTSATCAGVMPSWTTRYRTGSSGGTHSTSSSARQRRRASADDIGHHDEVRHLQACRPRCDRRDTSGFVHDGQLARVWLRRAITVFQDREPVAAMDAIEAHVRAWEAARTDVPHRLCKAVRGALREVITEVHRSTTPQSPAALVGAMLAPSTRIIHDNKRPPPSPHLRI
jgi:hypothetical protein